MIYLLCAYLIVNSFFAGRYYDRELTWADTPVGKVKLVLSCIAHILFFIPIAVSIFLWTAVIIPLDVLELRFWLQFWFTKKYHNVDVRALKAINEHNERRKHKRNLKSWVFNLGTLAVNKRNKYTPEK